VSQLGDARGDLVIESYPKNARTCTSATLDQVREDRFALLDDDRRESHRFRIVKRSEMGVGRKSGTRSPGFIDTVLGVINDFYGSVVQQITPWQPSAPKLAKQPTPEVETDDAPIDAEIVEEKVWSYEWPKSVD
jgi:hypothetical protein